ncbi:MAG: acyl-CoA dehydrogenase family protein [Gammaproteobacteria bacterium]|nr:acyl-CoA dehydrogenase family protein [Gammaproteobacteria bacterium]MDH3371890.1 acyl-CoA dehydrogenase family protein [Gammaproteobacteria bacterium]MDH3407781.1 acyl-CoA dehydrogenase family protein [Gammaproteobacteria bacterium]MDH3551438.1 acyl-CoA dehydrogenase family protein [Gammaproteobacteria bacterium]
MDTRFNAAQRKLRLELRDYFKSIMTPEVVAEVVGKEGGPRFREIIRKLGEDGILTLGWPKEYGGKEYTTVEQLILFEEAWSAHTPFPLITINTVGPAIMKFGTDEQKDFFLPKIAAGQCIFAVGYTEAGSGTDLASLKMPAVLDGDEYVVNGNKLFTSSGQDCDYVWLAVRTEKEVKRPSDGISIMIVDATDPGFSFAPINTVGDIETSMTYYENVRIPKDRVVGGINRGWKVITSQLNHERVTLASMTVVGAKQFRRVVKLLDEKSQAGDGPLTDPLVRAKVGELYCRLEAIEVLNLRTATQIEEGKLDVALASGVKFQNTLELIEVLRGLLDLVGEDALVAYPSEGAIFDGDLERDYRSAQVNTVGGGVMEVMRCMVASFGLEMPNTIA